MFNCPVCDVPIGELGPSGYLEVVCARCTYAFAVLVGRMTRAGAVYRHGTATNVYEVRLQLPSGELKALRRSSPDVTRWAGHRADHTILAVYTLRDGRAEDLVGLKDESTGERLSVEEPGRRGRVRAVWAASIVLVAGLVLGGFSPSPLALTWLLAIAVALGTYAAASRRFAPRQVLAPAERARLARLQSLLSTKMSLKAAGIDAAADRERRMRLSDRVDGLVERMRALDAALYANRIQQLGRARALLGEQALKDNQLIDGYKKAVAMVEIELEAGAIADSIPDEATARIDAHVAELKALRESIEERERQLAAIEEVERFLNPPPRTGVSEPTASKDHADLAPSIPLEHLFDDLHDDAEGTSDGAAPKPES